MRCSVGFEGCLDHQSLQKPTDLSVCLHIEGNLALPFLALNPINRTYTLNPQP